MKQFLEGMFPKLVRLVVLGWVRNWRFFGSLRVFVEALTLMKSDGHIEMITTKGKARLSGEEEEQLGFVPKQKMVLLQRQEGGGGEDIIKTRFICSGREYVVRKTLE